MSVVYFKFNDFCLIKVKKNVKFFLNPYIIEKTDFKIYFVNFN